LLEPPPSAQASAPRAGPLASPCTSVAHRIHGASARYRTSR
jgi:hypothetical protein